MPRDNKRFGVGANVTVLTRFLHPSAAIRHRHNNRTLPNNHRTNNLIIVRQETKYVRRKEQICFVYQHDDYKEHDNLTSIELYSVRKHAKCIQEGPDNLFFDLDEPEPVEEPILNQPFVQQFPNEVLNFDREEDNTTILVNNGITVDDDNLPLEGNINTGEPNTVFNEWGFNGICPRRAQMGNTKSRAKMVRNICSSDMELLFEELFPIKFIKEVILIESNKQLTPPLTIGEFKRFIGLFFLMSTTEGFFRRDFWSRLPINMFRGAPYRFHEYMTRNRFDAIASSLRFSNTISVPGDKFAEVRDMLSAWNRNMSLNFEPSWVSCLDESMSIWTNPWTCPGYMYVPRKPHPMGNEYHTVCCGESGVLYQLELVEGKDSIGPKEFDDRGKTSGLLLRLTRPIWFKGNVVVLDSGFCVLQAITDLKKNGVFAASLIKKGDTGQNISMAR
jgi:Transposase IS4